MTLRYMLKALLNQTGLICLYWGALEGVVYLELIFRVMEITVFLFCLEKNYGRESSLLLRQACSTQTSKWAMQPHKMCAALGRSQRQGTANQSGMKGAVSLWFQLEPSSTCFPFWQQQFFLIKLQYCQRAWGTGRTHGVLLQQGRPASSWAVWASRWGKWSFPCPLAPVTVQLQLCVQGWLQTDSDRMEQSHPGGQGMPGTGQAEGIVQSAQGRQQAQGGFGRTIQT